MNGERKFIIVSFREGKRNIVLDALKPIEDVHVVEAPTIYNHELFSFNSQENSILANGQAVILTPNESRLMTVLALTPNSAISFKDLSLLLFNFEPRGWKERNNVRSLVSRLRAKLNQLLGGYQIIDNVWGFGYKLVDNAHESRSE